VLEAAFVKVGLEVEDIVDLRASVKGDLVVGRVQSIEDLKEFKKPIRHCLVDVGRSQPQSIVCGATNFSAGDLVVVILPGGVLPGDFLISARETYGRTSAGMICSARELGLGDEHDGIIVLPADTMADPGDDARPVIGLDDIVVELNVTPDRGYCFSVRGLARELSHSLGIAFKDPASTVKPAKATKKTPYVVRVEDPLGCDRFVVRAVRGVDPAAKSPDWMRRRLTHAGMRPISLIVDITNYLMLELGQPMHAFDLGALRGDLVVRRARKGETLTTLDGARRTLDPEDLVIADNSGVISLAAVMGGASTEVSGETTDVLFEAAHWDPVTVARAARRHKLPSEASKRFERGVDPALGPVAVQRAVELLTAHGGGRAEPGVGDTNTVKAREAVRFAADRPARIAGVPYHTERVVELLRAIGCAVTVDGDDLEATPPTWRPDLTDPADFAEEVIRLDGYDAVPSELPAAPAGRGLTPQQRRRRTVARALAEAGYVETLSYPFVGMQTLEALGLPDDDPRRELVTLANPISEEEPGLRTTLLPPLLAALKRNVGRGQRDVALFELGSVFHPAAVGKVPPRLGVDKRPSDTELAAATEAIPTQPWHVAAVAAGDAEPAGWWGPARAVTWADAVEAARIALSAAGAQGQALTRRGSTAPWHPGRCAEFVVGDTVIGHAGELHPSACAALELPTRTVAMELNLELIPLPGVIAAPAVSAYPPALIDVALVVPADTPAADVRATLIEGAGPLLESVRLFDVFTGAQVGEGRRSLAYNLIFRAPDRTLTGEEAVAARDAAVALAAKRHNALLRGA
jgi:phenylalanyl-tRNA synthetase beta chain